MALPSARLPPPESRDADRCSAFDGSGRTRQAGQAGLLRLSPSRDGTGRAKRNHTGSPLRRHSQRSFRQARGHTSQCFRAKRGRSPDPFGRRKNRRTGFRRSPPFRTDPPLLPCFFRPASMRLHRGGLEKRRLQKERVLNPCPRRGPRKARDDTWENAPVGARSANGHHKARLGFVGRTTPENFLGFRRGVV